MKIIDQDQYEEHCEAYDGFCRKCKKFTNDGGVEPDAEGYVCEECGGKHVCGAEQAFVLGEIEVGE